MANDQCVNGANGMEMGLFVRVNRSRWRHALLSLSAGFYATVLIWPQTADARSIFLNGVDISNTKSQEIFNATVRIDEHGNLFLEAPHYQVIEEDRYLPLTTYVQGLNRPGHQKQAQPTGDSIGKAPIGMPIAPATGSPVFPASALPPGSSGGTDNAPILPPGSEPRAMLTGNPGLTGQQGQQNSQNPAQTLPTTFQEKSGSDAPPAGGFVTP